MVLIFGHRGFAAKFPENTMLSFTKAIGLKVDGIELDVHATKDGELVVMHDEAVDRTTNGKGLIKDMTYENFAALDAGQGEHPPRLEDVILLCKDNDVLLNIEIKAQDIEQGVLDMVNKHEFQANVLCSSFKHDILAKIKELQPEMKTAVLVPTTPAGFAAKVIAAKLNSEQKGMIDQALKVNANGINPFSGTCSEKFFATAKEKNLEIYPWTVDAVKAAQNLARWGATGIITNHPARLIEAGLKKTTD
ncbi:MAG TPA: glycerophosphodiester phosphodiesterase family protein [Candidatus Lokiarchaeia archaeon]|nr:glycerophosphodiester phosphodiesterase family protein [Candidatus Lokiarchaeia archaeon]